MKPAVSPTVAQSAPATSPAGSAGGGVFARATAAQGRFPYPNHRTVAAWFKSPAKPVALLGGGGSGFIAVPPRNKRKFGKCTACTASVQRTCDWHGCPQRTAAID